MPSKPTDGTHFTLPNKNFPNPMKLIPGLFKDFHGPPSFSITFKALN